MHTFEVIACIAPGPNEICDEEPATWTWTIVKLDPPVLQLLVPPDMWSLTRVCLL